MTKTKGKQEITEVETIQRKKVVGWKKHKIELNRQITREELVRETSLITQRKFKSIEQALYDNARNHEIGNWIIIKGDEDGKSKKYSKPLVYLEISSEMLEHFRILPKFWKKETRGNTLDQIQPTIIKTVLKNKAKETLARKARDVFGKIEEQIPMSPAIGNKVPHVKSIYDSSLNKKNARIKGYLLKTILKKLNPVKAPKIIWKGLLQREYPLEEKLNLTWKIQAINWEIILRVNRIENLIEPILKKSKQKDWALYNAIQTEPKLREITGLKGLNGTQKDIPSIKILNKKKTLNGGHVNGNVNEAYINIFMNFNRTKKEKSLLLESKKQDPLVKNSNFFEMEESEKRLREQLNENALISLIKKRLHKNTIQKWNHPWWFFHEEIVSNKEALLKRTNLLINIEALKRNVDELKNKGTDQIEDQVNEEITQILEHMIQFQGLKRIQEEILTPKEEIEEAILKGKAESKVKKRKPNDKLPDDFLNWVYETRREEKYWLWNREIAPLAYVYNLPPPPDKVLIEQGKNLASSKKSSKSKQVEMKDLDLETIYAFLAYFKPLNPENIERWKSWGRLVLSSGYIAERELPLFMGSLDFFLDPTPTNFKHF
jgi:hypothetical protein